MPVGASSDKKNHIRFRRSRATFSFSIRELSRRTNGADRGGANALLTIRSRTVKKSPKDLGRVPSGNDGEGTKCVSNAMRHHRHSRCVDLPTSRRSNN